VRHQYFPRFKGDPATWPALYEALFQLQVPGRPLRNTLYTGEPSNSLIMIMITVTACPPIVFVPFLLVVSPVVKAPQL
jgi:hypothetical protein